MQDLLIEIIAVVFGVICGSALVQILCDFISEIIGRKNGGDKHSVVYMQSRVYDHFQMLLRSRDSWEAGLNRIQLNVLVQHVKARGIVSTDDWDMLIAYHPQRAHVVFQPIEFDLGIERIHLGIRQASKTILKEGYKNENSK